MQIRNLFCINSKFTGKLSEYFCSTYSHCIYSLCTIYSFNTVHTWYIFLLEIVAIPQFLQPFVEECQSDIWNEPGQNKLVDRCTKRAFVKDNPCIAILLLILSNAYKGYLGIDKLL